MMQKFSGVFGVGVFMAIGAFLAGCTSSQKAENTSVAFFGATESETAYQLAKRTHDITLHPDPTLAHHDVDPEKTIEVHFLEVGQGDATFVRFPEGGTLLIDGGASGPVDPFAVRQYLHQQLDVNRPVIDTLVITHAEADNYNLLPFLLEGVAVGNVLYVGQAEDYTAGTFQSDGLLHDDIPFSAWLSSIPEKQHHSLHYRDRARPYQPSKGFNDGPAKVYVLAASVQDANPEWRTDSSSIVLKITYGQFDVTLTGDATFSTEDDIIAHYPPGFLQSDVLKLSRHGSNSTSTEHDWVDAISPKVAVASSAYENEAGYPQKEVFDLLADYTWDNSITDRPTHTARYYVSPTHGETIRNYHESIYSTAVNGNVVITSNGSPWFHVWLNQ